MASRCRSTAAPCQICSHWLRCATRAEARAMLLTERLGLQDRSACLLLALLQQPLRLSTRASALAIAQGTTSILTAQIERCRAEQNPRALPQAGPIAGAKGERVAACGAWRQDHRLVLLCDCGGCAAGCVLPQCLPQATGPALCRCPAETLRPLTPRRWRASRQGTTCFSAMPRRGAAILGEFSTLAQSANISVKD